MPSHEAPAPPRTTKKAADNGGFQTADKGLAYPARFPEVSLADAREWARQTRREIVEGRRQTSDDEPLRVKHMVSHFLDNYAVNKRTFAEDKRILSRPDDPAKIDYLRGWHNRDVASITRAECVALLQTIATNNGPIMSNRVRAALSACYAYAINNPPIETEPDGMGGLRIVKTFAPIPFNPFRDIIRIGKEKESDRTYSDDEIRSLWKAFDALGTAGSVFKLALLTGARRGEACGMLDSEIDGNDWNLPGSRTKNGKFLILPLPEFTLNFIRQLQAERDASGMEQTPFVFPSPRKPKQAVTVGQNAAYRVRELSGVTDFRAHDLRRTTATGITRLGHSRFIADCVLNHTEAGVGRRYDRHSYYQEKRAALSDWTQHVRSLVDPTFNLVSLDAERG